MDEYFDNTGAVEQYSFDDSSSQDENVGEETVQQSDDSLQNTESDSGEQTEQSADDVKEDVSGEHTEQSSDDVKEDDSNIIDILSEIVKDKLKNEEVVSLDPDVSIENDTSISDNENVEKSDSDEVLENDKREVDKNVNQNDSENSIRSVETIENDYSPILGDILHALDIVSGNQETMIEAASQNSMNSGLESQSATNVLLIVIIVILLFDIVVHFIGRLF